MAGPVWAWQLAILGLTAAAVGPELGGLALDWLAEQRRGGVR